eukprot:TRINITY_DN3779_c0_g1_i18.p1 TRINITY_DN3779_c0_g1~~TRINITY_DN3779_c0_g1_i18.p1  ORF type:complete len:126 (-),score=14.97 TRINITY_DN3779_c0_g1_i18:2850-3227(-)
MLDKASKISSSSNYFEASAMYKTIEQFQLKLCHSHSISLLRTQETLLKILMELKDWREALVYCQSTIPVYQRVYPAIHPLLGLQYYTCGKLEWLALSLSLSLSPESDTGSTILHRRVEIESIIKA